MRFIGNKESLAPQIFTLLQKYKVIDSQKTQSFFDLFSGSASMAKFFKKQGFQIYSNDILYFSYCLQRAYIQNNEIPQFNGLKKLINSTNTTNSLFQSHYQKVLLFLDSIPIQKGFIYNHYAPNATKDLKIPRMYFIDKNAAKIDAIRLQIEAWKNNKAINENEYFILLATLIESVSFYANVAGVYAAFCKTWDKRALKDFNLKEIDILISDKKHFCFCDDGVKLLQNLHKIFDILYLDPPYNHRQYAPNYHLIETIAKYENPNIKGIAGLREWQNQKSDFCNAKNALIELEKIIKYKNYRNLVLSYNSEGIMQKEAITELLKPLGNLYFESILYPRFKSNNKKSQKYINEYVWILQL